VSRTIRKFSKGGGMTVLVLGMIAVLAACGREEPRPDTTTEAAKTHVHQAAAENAPRTASGVTEVASRDVVCMVTNRVFHAPQIPVEVGGRTYYGCCEGCKATLANDASARRAIDPVSGRSVDKAEAVIGALPDGSVLYFENAANLRAWNAARG
jgi:YHS domain-containing protein